jgi:glutamine transport system substrate-binding protein
MIKRKLTAALASLSVAMLVPLSNASAQSDKELIVAVDTAFVPFEFKHGDTYTGFDVDLWDALAKELHIKYRLQPMDFNGIVPGLQTKNIDVALAGITIREDRKAVIDFSEPYYRSGLAILVNNKTNDIKTVEDLKGKTVAVKIGTATVDFLQKEIPSAKLTLFPNIDNAYLELATGRVDAVVHDTPNVQYYANSAGKDRVKMVGTIKSGDYYGIAFPKGSPLVEQVNNALATLQSNGEYEAIYTKWFGKLP